MSESLSSENVMGAFLRTNAGVEDNDDAGEREFAWEAEVEGGVGCACCSGCDSV